MRINKLFYYLQFIFAPLLIFLGNCMNYRNPRFLCNIKNLFLKLSGIRIKNKVIISAGFQCLYPKNILIQDCVALGHYNHIWAFDQVIIGSYTQTARDLLIVAGSHDISSYVPIHNQNVIIGQGCWIGARVTILGRVRIGKGCVIGAGSLVNKDIPDWSVAVGVPAKVIRQRIPSNVILCPFGEYSPDELKDIE
ncbi:DapH/DapD/GlmU-related protein [Methanosarcina lacustris]|uniref:DapH/DapD/GlmU-related protein n=1 Tax=Methanosarcina lacustris TaxID=170861 RepID=UPI0006980364|nr:DapH/DapD/GlmU-related protein [Methanosarcina lacustris]